MRIRYRTPTFLDKESFLFVGRDRTSGTSPADSSRVVAEVSERNEDETGVRDFSAREIPETSIA